MSPGESTSSKSIELVSCHSDWVFDLERKKFLRLPRGGAKKERLHFGENTWADFDELSIDADTGEFVVYLNAAKSHMLRSFQHGEPCERCSEQSLSEPTREIPKVPKG